MGPLCRAAQELAPGVRAVGLDARANGWDILSDEDFGRLLRQVDAGIRWFHGAPPCRTFSKARRQDQFGSCRVLRTAADIYGFGAQETEEANAVAKR
eukprot:3982962-Alexandrium_andersonii.AAC.1